MQSWLINPAKLQKLREEAQLTPEKFAPLAGCHPQHYRKLERHQQPSDALAWRILNALSMKLGRTVRIEDVAVPKDVDQQVAA